MVEDERREADAGLELEAGAADLAQRKLEEDERKRRQSRQPPVRKAFPAELRRVDNLLVVDAEQRRCPQCSGERKCIGHEVGEVVELVPAELIVRRDLREKLACESCEAEVVRAPVGDKVVEGGRCGPKLVGTLLVDKYLDGLPWHRQSARYEKLGWKMPVSTMADQAKWAAERLRPLWRLALEQCVQAKVMHTDATSMPALDKMGDKGLRIGSMWGYIGEDPVVDGEGSEQVACIIYTSTGKKTKQREHELGPEDVLALREGYTVADASNIFDASFARPGLVECGCNMHARRYFKKVLDSGDTRAARPLAAFKRLYGIEADIRELPPEKKGAARAAQSRSVYDALVEWCEAYKPHEPPATPMGKAVRYLLNHREALMRFLDDGVIPIDNGVVERLHVRTALTRKNFLFVGSDEGGHRAATIYTMISCCRLVEVDPVEYFADVLPRLGGKHTRASLLELMPARWKASRQGTPPLDVT
ncbi:MAG: IS66 family transposase [Acidobacteria bacterium]|nr:IS66 family transposase [Acidobacteriota bacterium]